MVAFAGAGAALAGCQSAPIQYAGQGANATYQAASVSFLTVRSAGGEIYNGAGRAVSQPFHDLNMMQDQIPPVLLRAESHPYDLAGVNSCTDVLNRVSELDLALGPDVDLPKLKRKRSALSADFAAGAALDAAGSAAEHFIPMRSTIRQLSGAQRYDNHVKHAVLSGTTRRSFLKAVGMSHNCGWPAAPVDFTPSQPAVIDALWVAPAPSAPVMMVAASTPAAMTADQSATVRVAQVTLISATSPRRTPSGRTASGHALHGPVRVAVSARLALPSAAPPAQAPAQQWRAPHAMGIETVSTPLTTTAAVAPAAAPWSQGFAGASVHP
jgi:hypothetical protein